MLEGKLQQLGLGREKLQQLFPNLRTEVAVLYSNRSGSRLMTSKPHSALADALRAMELDPKFMRAVSRAATCHCRFVVDGCTPSRWKMPECNALAIEHRVNSQFSAVSNARELVAFKIALRLAKGCS